MTDKREILERMWLAGEKRIVIATELGVSVDWVKKQKRKMGLPPRDEREWATAWMRT